MSAQLPQSSALPTPTGDARIRDVAEHHGFSDSKYFSKVFHQVLGLTPSQWLQRHAQSGAAQEVLA